MIDPVIEQLDGLENVLLGMPVPPPAGHTRKMLAAIDHASFDAELSPILARIGLAILKRQACTPEDRDALRRLARVGSYRVSRIASQILNMLEKRWEPKTNADAIQQLESLSSREVAHAR